MNQHTLRSLATQLLLLLAACSSDDASQLDPDAQLDADTNADADLGADGQPGDTVGPWELDPRFAELAAAIEADLEASNATAASVAVWLDDEIVWVGGFGTMDADGAVPPREATQFMIGSDTKKIAAIAALQAVQRGELRLDTTVAEVFPELELANAEPFLEATLEELLSHQGGIADAVEVATETTDADLVRYLSEDLEGTVWSLAPPGIFWNYSNPNFSVAGAMTEVSAGSPWADLVERDIFAPLGMSRTVARKADVDADHCAGVGIESPEDAEIGPVSLENTWESAFVRPAGLVWSTPSDQMRLARFLVDGDPVVLPEELRQALVAPHAPVYPDLPGDYGFGLMISDGVLLESGWHPTAHWSHGGNTWTHTSTFHILPEERFAISILSNGLGDDFTRSVATAFETLVELPAATTAPEPPFDAAGLDALTGTYVDDFNVGELIISREGDGLALRAPTLDEFGVEYERVLEPLSTRVWLVTADGATLDFAFIDGPDGETYFRNRSVVAVRAPESKQASAPPARSLDAVLRALHRGARNATAL